LLSRLAPPDNVDRLGGPRGQADEFLLATTIAVSVFIKENAHLFEHMHLPKEFINVFCQMSQLQRRIVRYLRMPQMRMVFSRD
jgi:hypothetical protein